MKRIGTPAFMKPFGPVLELGAHTHAAGDLVELVFPELRVAFPFKVLAGFLSHVTLLGTPPKGASMSVDFSLA
ncbi:MAG: hypothetical protein JO104_10100 [Candidatus Eremiobacteraeota bacterium]|nr:hypothetical protein [Candidatus Eremiobacteraeota bacterium]